MSLNIKNDETCRLVGELARLTGETMTGAITIALRERLERERCRRGADALARELHAIGQRCASLLGRGLRPWSMAICFTMTEGLPE